MKPQTLVLVVLALALAGAGAWFYLRRRRGAAPAAMGGAMVPVAAGPPVVQTKAPGSKKSAGAKVGALLASGGTALQAYKQGSQGGTWNGLAAALSSIKF